MLPIMALPWFRLIGNFVPNLERLYSRAHSGQTRRGGLNFLNANVKILTGLACQNEKSIE